MSLITKYWKNYKIESIFYIKKSICLMIFNISQKHQFDTFMTYFISIQNVFLLIESLSFLFIYIKDSPLKALVIRFLLETIYLRLSLVSFHCTKLHFQFFADDILLIYSILFFNIKYDIHL